MHGVKSFKKIQNWKLLTYWLNIHVNSYDKCKYTYTHICTLYKCLFWWFTCCRVSLTDFTQFITFIWHFLHCSCVWIQKCFDQVDITRSFRNLAICLPYCVQFPIFHLKYFMSHLVWRNIYYFFMFVPCINSIKALFIIPNWYKQL